MHSFTRLKPFDFLRKDSNHVVGGCLAPSGPCARNCGFSRATLTDSVRLATGPGDGDSGLSPGRKIWYVGTASFAGFLIDACLLALRLDLDTTTSSAAVHAATA